MIGGEKETNNGKTVNNIGIFFKFSSAILILVTRLGECIILNNFVTSADKRIHVVYRIVTKSNDSRRSYCDLHNMSKLGSVRHFEFCRKWN